jgi:hypothetical protein
MNLFQEGWAKFTDIARQRGLTQKVVGDYAYTNKRKSRHIKLVRIGRDRLLSIRESGKPPFTIAF